MLKKYKEVLETVQSFVKSISRMYIDSIPLGFKREKAWGLKSKRNQNLLLMSLYKVIYVNMSDKIHLGIAQKYFETCCEMKYISYLYVQLTMRATCPQPHYSFNA